MKFQRNTIGTMVMEGLKELDPVAYVRFASVYRNFREEKDFVQFVDKLDVYKKDKFSLKDKNYMKLAINLARARKGPNRRKSFSRLCNSQK